ncbi:aminodeoxyfutalosine synthase [Filimonas sp.]|nr:aminodeoxyfutalosine synthase [Filimonas sp.]
MPSIEHIQTLLTQDSLSQDLKNIAQKVLHHERISTDDALILYKEGEIGFLGALANFIREEKFGDKTFFNRNFHIEPTNVCVFSCAFCSYSRLYKNKEEGWELSAEQMMHIVKNTMVSLSLKSIS